MWFWTTSNLVLFRFLQTAGSLDRLQRTVQNLFPQCTRQREVGGGSFTPHVTLGQFESLSAVEAKIAELSAQPPVEFDVDFLSLLGRTATGPFECKHKASLFGTGEATRLAASTDSIMALGDLFGSQSIPIHDVAVPALQKQKKVKAPYTGPKTGNTPKKAPVQDDTSFGSLFSSGSFPVDNSWDQAASSSEPWDALGASDSTASSTTTSSSYARKPRTTGTEFKSSYYKDKPSTLNTSPKTTSAAAKKTPSKLTASPTTTLTTSPLGSFTVSAPPVFASPSAPAPSKYALAIEPPTAPKFTTTLGTGSLLSTTSTLSTTSSLSSATPSSYATLGSFTPSKPPAPIVLSSPAKKEAKPTTTSSPKSKESSYYKGEKRAVIGRRSDGPSAESSEISDMFHVEMEPYVEPEPVFKVIATAKSSPSPVLPEHESTVHKVTQWLTTLEAAKRPRNRSKLGNSISKMCMVTVSGMTAEEALNALVAQGHVNVAGNNVTIPTKGEKATQRENMLLSNQISYKSESEAAFDRCLAWILDPDNKPKTRAALLNTLRQLVQAKKHVSTDTIVQYLIDAGQLNVLQDDKGVEHLEYLL